MRELQLYMWSGTRGILLERHRFHVEQVRLQQFAQFRDIDGEADRYADATYERIGALPSHGEHDVADISEAAWDEAIGFHGQLTDLRKQIILNAIAGMFHQWDKDLRGFIDRELARDIGRGDIMKHVWKSTGADIVQLLEEFGWPVRQAPFYPSLEALGLIVNVYKHGKGPSLKTLHERYPRYLRGGSTDRLWLFDYIDHDWLTVEESDFEEFAAAIETFWSDMPERLYHILPT